jgi:hypothetical protein
MVVEISVTVTLVKSREDWRFYPEEVPGNLRPIGGPPEIRAEHARSVRGGSGPLRQRRWREHTLPAFDF